MANGIPSLLNKVANVLNNVSLLVSDIGILFGLNQWNWGIYYAGTNTLAIDPDSVEAIDYKKEYKISDYPIELGTFSQYNKVELPFVSTVRLMIGSSIADRTDFLQTLESLASSTELFDVVTPERTFVNANIVGFDYQRTATNGAAMITADIKLQEIRLTAVTSFSHTESVTDANPSNSGQLVPQNTNGVPTSASTLASPATNPPSIPTLPVPKIAVSPNVTSTTPVGVL